MGRGSRSSSGRKGSSGDGRTQSHPFKGNQYTSGLGGSSGRNSGSNRSNSNSGSGGTHWANQWGEGEVEGYD
ncbi:MAG: hypothetical protein U0V74_14965 [Chitinophagales bacterium]